MMKRLRKNLSLLYQLKWQTLSIILGIFLAVMLFQYTKIKGQITNYNTQELSKKLAKIMLLPDEQPQFTLITDINFYKTNWPDFYHAAQPGIILIQYQNSSLLYDPVNNKILNFASNGVFTKPKPTENLHISLRYNGNESYRALFLKRQIEEDGWNSAFEITEVVQSNAVYKSDVIYLVNNQKKDLASKFAKTIGNSPIIEILEPNEAPTAADIIVSFKSML